MDGTPGRDMAATSDRNAKNGVARSRHDEQHSPTGVNAAVRDHAFSVLRDGEGFARRPGKLASRVSGALSLDDERDLGGSLEDAFDQVFADR
jgi:hypothetical protein